MKDNQDNLENLFRRKFNDEETIIQDKGWNKPSEEVWDRIQIGLVEEKKVSRRIMYWPLVGIAASFLLLSIFPFYQSKNKIDSLAAKLESNEQALKTIQQKLENVTATAHSTQKTPLQEGKILTNEETVLEKRTVTTAIKLPVSTSETVISHDKKASESKLTNSYVIAPLLSSQLLDKEVANLPTPITLANQSAPVSNFKVSELPTNTTAKSYPLLANLPNLEQQLPANFSKKEVVPSPVLAPIKNNKFYLAATVAPTWGTYNKKKNAALAVNLEPKSDRQKSAFSAGIQAGRKLGKGWAIESGLRYTSTNNAAQDTRAVTYRQVAEHLNQHGDYESNWRVQMESSAGQTETVVVISRAALSSIEEDTEIDLDFTLTNAQSYIDIPVLARKQWRVGNLGLGITAGLLNRFLLEKSFDLPTVTLNDQRFNAQSLKVSEKEGASSNAAYLPHYLVGLDFEYEIYPGLYVFITPTLSKSIRPTIEADSADIYTKEKMLNMGIRYQL